MVGRDVRAPIAQDPSPGRTTKSRRSSDAEALEYARGIHAEARETNKDLFTRAQIVLTVDGVLIAWAAGVLGARPDDLARTVAVFGWTTWAELAIALAAFVVSVLSAALALYPRSMQGPGPTPGEINFSFMWFFRHVADIDPDTFVEAAQRADAASEVRARLTQVAIMSPLMVRRVRWLNRAFAALAVALALFSVAAADYVIRLNG